MVPFPSRTHHVEECLHRWSRKSASLVQVDSASTHSGEPVYAITLTDDSVRREDKQALYVAQPHAHEPGPTAGMIDVIEQLVTGRRLDGSPTRLDAGQGAHRRHPRFTPTSTPHAPDPAPVDVRTRQHY